MGESKRRKKLDPNYGKQKNYNIKTFDLIKLLYSKYGKGILALGMPSNSTRHCTIAYMMPSHVDFQESDEEILKTCDFENSFILTHPKDFGKSGFNYYHNTPFVTYKITNNSSISSLMITIIINKNESFDNALEKALEDIIYR